MIEIKMKIIKKVYKDYAETERFLIIYYELIRAAQKQTTVYYGDISPMIGLPSEGNDVGKKMGNIVEQINRWERSQRRPMLSAVLIKTQVNIPGRGFFKLAKDLGNFQGDIKDNKDRRKFWEDELQAVYEAWS
jgi:hypothetical protein